MEHADRLTLEASLDAFESAIDDAFSDGLLAVEHDAVDDLGHEHRPVDGVGLDLARLDLCSARH